MAGNKYSSKTRSRSQTVTLLRTAAVSMSSIISSTSVALGLRTFKLHIDVTDTEMSCLPHELLL